MLRSLIKDIKRQIIKEILYYKAINLENTGEYKNASNMLFLSMSINPKAKKTLLALTRCHEKQNLLPNAIDFIDRIIKLHPKNSSFYEIRANLNIKLKEYDIAVEDYENAIKFSRKPLSLYQNKVKLYFIKDDMQNAIQDLNQAINKLPKEASLYEQRGFYKLLLKSYDSALEDYIIAEKYNPKNKNNTYIKTCLEEIINLKKEAK